MVEQVYRARKPMASPLWQCLARHFAAFLNLYDRQYQSRYGFLRPVIPEVVNKFLDCGNLERGFARVRCDHCKHEYLLAFSCKGRWFCPSCHQKKVQLFGALLMESILYPVPHRHITFCIPKMLRPYFRFNRELLKDLCLIAHESLLDFMRATLRLPNGIPGIVMTIHTFGEYLDFHPHLHALVADGLYARSGLFYVLPNVSMKPLEELFRARVITFLVGKGLLPAARGLMLRGWKHSGFNVYRSRKVRPRQRRDLERLAQYIIRNPFSVDKMLLSKPGGTSSADSIIYRSGLNPKIRRNFEVFTPCDFIAAITQHIPDKSFQLVRYYGWYSNKMRGQRAKQKTQPLQPGKAIQMIDISGNFLALNRDRRSLVPGHRRIPSAKWRELIKKVYEADPLMCPRCSHEMRIISLIDDRRVIERILRHLGLLSSKSVGDRQQGECLSNSTGPPPDTPDEMIVEPYFDDPFPDYDTEPVLQPSA